MSWGVVVAADKNIESLLPWWWACYSKHHTERVAFVDLGMTPTAKKWCQKRGIYLEFQGAPDFVLPKEKVSEPKQKQWEKLYGASVWTARSSWFKKPLAMLMTPFEKTIWLDVDCEVCQSIEGIFEGIERDVLGAVCVEEKGHYNSGVIAYGKDSSLLKAWAELCLRKHGSVIGDETLLTEVILKNQHPFKSLDRSYNWMMGWGYHPELKVAHWAASWGKLCIESMGGIQGYLETLKG